MKKRNFLRRASKTLVRFIWQILTVVAVVGWVFLLISAFSDRVSPLQNSNIPFFGLFFPVILLINLVFFSIFLIFQKWKHVIAAVVIFVICGGSIRTYFSLHTRKEVPTDCIKVITYNVMNFGSIYKHTESDPHPILQYVIDQDPDIVCFQEYALARKLSLEVVQKALKNMPYYSSKQGDLAVFSKYPISSVKKISLENWRNNACSMELDINGRKVTLVNLHLQSNGIALHERAEYLDFINEPDRQKLENFTGMMFKRLTPAFKKRAVEAKIITYALRENPNPYLIICGDFNDTPISYARRTIKGNLKDAFVESGKGMGISYNRHRFLFRIDYILYSKNMKAYNCTVGRLKTSDHYPVSTYLQFRD
jgi:endonuclease/exonuclease/phosphatase family metal-dependent hydrolase